MPTEPRPPLFTFRLVRNRPAFNDCCCRPGPDLLGKKHRVAAKDRCADGRWFFCSEKLRCLLNLYFSKENTPFGEGGERGAVPQRGSSGWVLLAAPERPCPARCRRGQRVLLPTPLTYFAFLNLRPKPKFPPDFTESRASAAAAAGGQRSERPACAAARPFWSIPFACCPGWGFPQEFPGCVCTPKGCSHRAKSAGAAREGAAGRSVPRAELSPRPTARAQTPGELK